MLTSFYIGACSQNENGGIYGYDRNCRQTFFEPLRGVSYLAFSNDKTLLYAVCADDGINKAVIYQIREDGSIYYLDARETLGKSTCHLTVDPDNKFLYCASYRTGTINEFRLENGLFAEPGPGRIIETTGSVGPQEDRQDRSHAHCTVFTPDQKYLCVVDLGVDEVQLFPFTRGVGIPEEPSFRYHSPVPGAGPRHLLFAPDGKIAWLANELNNTVSSLRYEAGTLTHIQTWSTIPEDFTAFTKVAAVRLSHNGRHLCVSNRGHDSIACYYVRDNGGLSLYDIVSSEGISPRDINFLPDSKTSVACNETSDTVQFFQYNQVDGKLTFKHETEAMPGPLCALIV